VSGGMWCLVAHSFSKLLTHSHLSAKLLMLFHRQLQVRGLQVRQLQVRHPAHKHKLQGSSHHQGLALFSSPVQLLAALALHSVPAPAPASAQAQASRTSQSS